MEKTSNTTKSSPQSVLPIPFTLEQLRQDILDIYLLQLRNTYLFTNDQKIWTLAGKDGVREGEIWDGMYAPDAFGLTYEDVKDSEFAKALEQQYSFGFFGIDNNQCEPMEFETMHGWVAAYLRDLTQSASVLEWQQFGAQIDPSRCIHTAELANARVILEGKESFYPYMYKDENRVEEKALTVRQMALLSGMEEMTIRTAISRTSANQLQAFKKDRSTLIHIKDAKAWLMAKGRYVPITYKTSNNAELDLEKTGFLSINGFVQAMVRRINYFEQTQPELNVFKRFEALSIEKSSETGKTSHREELLDTEWLTQVAEILQLPTTLLILRAKEAVLREDSAIAADALSATTAAIAQARDQLKSAPIQTSPK